LTFGASAPLAARANLIIEESAILGLNARVIGEAKPISAHMIEYTQQRRDQFSRAGVQRAN